MAAESQSHHHQILLHRHHQREPPQRPPPSRGLRSTAGQIVEVQGGHIVRSTGRKDRHSKVCTAKGPRDRRVRLSAHTAIQFYDVQDRLGYDRPSKAVDWLIKNAKAAIDELAELPAWHPTATVVNTDNQENHGGGDMHVVSEHGNSSNYHEFGGGGGGDGGGSSSFLPPSLDSDAIADTIKSFFPMAAAAASSSAPSSSGSPIGFQSYPPPDLLTRASSQSQDLRLSLQSFQDPIFHHPQSTAHHQLQQQQNQNAAASHHHSLFSGFDAASMVPWEVAESSSGGGGGGGYVFSVPLQQQALAMHHGLSHGNVPGQSQQFFTQRGPLQSSNPPFVRAWAEPMAAAADHQMHHHPAIHHPIGFASGSSSGFSGFRIPARIQGEEEENDGKPSSTSSGSHH